MKKINQEKLLNDRKTVENRRKSDLGRELSPKEKAKLKKLQRNS